AEAHLALAQTLREDQAAAAMRALRPALALAPGLPEVQLLAGSLLAEAGDPGGLYWLESAIARDPDLPVRPERPCRITAQRGARARADAMFDATLARPQRPVGPSLFRHPLWFGDRERARAAGERVSAFHDPFADTVRAIAAALDGQGPEGIFAGL